MKDRLYLLRPSFSDRGDGPFFCGECAVVEGMLGFYPELRQEIDVHYVSFQRPRPEIVRELGPDHQSAPVLVLGDPLAPVPASVRVQEAHGRRFLDNEFEICNYLAARYRVGRIHHPTPAPAR